MFAKKVISAVLLMGALGACDATNEIMARNTVSTSGVQLPEGIVLSANDSAIWNGLSDAERNRAIQFLQNGGTVAGSVGAS
jgi:hypothetical protein